MISAGWQIREARQLADVTQHALATAADVDFDLVIRAELMGCFPMPNEPHVAAMQAALEAAGVEFIPENGDGAGVRLQKGEA